MATSVGLSLPQFKSCLDSERLPRGADRRDPWNTQQRPRHPAVRGDHRPLPAGDSTQQGGGVRDVRGPVDGGQYASIYDRRWTVGDLFNFEPNKYYDVGQYASYVVTVSFKGKSRTYRALALFHNPHGSVESLKPEIRDTIVRASALKSRTVIRFTGWTSLTLESTRSALRPTSSTPT
jgi:hypothetical protein